MSIQCEYCGKEKQENTFVIGASKEPEWCMVEGTGKMACPDCYEQASNEGQNVINNHIKELTMRTKTRKKIEDFVSQWERFGNCYFWSSPSNASSRRYYEKQNSRDLNLDLDGDKISGKIDIKCSCKNIYCKRYIEINGVKKTIRVLKNILDKKFEDKIKAKIRKTRKEKMTPKTAYKYLEEREGKLFSVYNGEGYKINRWKKEKATNDHTGGYYSFKTIQDAFETRLNNNVFAEAWKQNKKLVLCEVKIKGQVYTQNKKLCSDYIKVKKVLG